MKLIEDIINNVWFQRIFWSIIVTLVAVFIYHLVAKFLSSKEKKNSRVFQNKKNKTFIRMLKSIVAYGL
ncbi:hypothetical protein IJ135_01050, partial [Candidatus Saccharibacteria bacterium]|nr:hypothetical protein [Candidatus Saccharibacteria bacterium]